MPIPIAVLIIGAVLSAAAKAKQASDAKKAAGESAGQAKAAAAGQTIAAIGQGQQQLAQKRTQFNQQVAGGVGGMGDSPLGQILGGQQQQQPPEIPQVGQDDQLKQLLDSLQQQRSVFSRTSPDDFGGL